MFVFSSIVALATAALSLLQEISIMGFSFPNFNVYNMARTIYEALTTRGASPNIPDAVFILTAVVVVAALLGVLSCLTMLLGRRSAASALGLSAVLCIGLCVYANYQLKSNMPSVNGVTLNLYDGLVLKELLIWGAGYVIAAVLSFMGGRDNSRKSGSN